MKAGCLSLSPPLLGGCQGLVGLCCLVGAVFTTGAVANADTYGYEFHPGPGVPEGFTPGPGVDARGMDLSGSVFIGMDLSHARFEGCNLQRARFYQARFFSGGGSFRSADLRNAAFLESPDQPFRGRFADCDFTDALINGLSFLRQQDHLTLDQIRSTRSYKLKDLSACQIVAGVHEKEHYSYKNLTIKPVAVDLREFDLRDATFVAGDFTECDFRDAVITGATFVRSILTPAQIMSTKRYVMDPELDVSTGSMYANPARQLVARNGYADIGFSLVDLSSWDFTNADLRGARFHDAKLDGVSFVGADISGAEFWKSITQEQLLSTKSYKEGNLASTMFVWLDLSKMDFSRRILAGARFVYCDLSRADFTDAVITEADFRYLDDPPTVEQIKSTWNYKHGRMGGIFLPRQLQDALEVPE
jgi:uncharacterized protein YjbI with pentapeptide repeats